MGDVAIRVEKLSKVYRIGKAVQKINGHRSLVHTAAAPFRYLASTLRPPDDDEILWALKDVSFEVNRGEVLGIVGRNGAGKSTLLKILSRITEPTYGRAFINGRIGSLLEVGTGFHPELTGRENIYLNGAILGMRRSEIERKFDGIVAFAEVEKFLDTPVKRYSSGMYVRLAFAVAAHLEPEILLVDEVLAVGDAAFQNKCLGKMGDVAQEGRTILFVSHNMMAIQQICRRGLLIKDGKVYSDGKTATVIETYLGDNSDSLVSSKDLTKLERRPQEGDKFRYTKIVLNDNDSRIKLWDPLKIELDFEVRTHIIGVVPGITIMSMGSAVMSSDSQDVGTLLDFAQPQSGKIEVNIPHPNLAPGRYYIRIGARSGTHTIDWLDNVLAFDVIEAEYGSLYVTKSLHGMRPQSDWRIALNS